MTQAVDGEVDQTEQPEVPEEELNEIEQPEGEPEGQPSGEPESEPEGGEVVVTIGEESPPQEDAERAPEWVRDLRKSNREKERENRELKKQLDALKATPADKTVQVGEKPTLEGCEYDTERFEKDLEQWHERKREHAEQERKKHEEGAKVQQAWQAKLDAYGKQKSELKVSDYEDAEAAAQDILSVTQQGVIVSGAENPALVVYALGKNPKKAQELASIADPVKFAFAVARLETQMKVTPRKTAPLPESTVRGNARVSAGIDSTLERLRAEAEKTGDMSKVLAHKRQLASRVK